MAIPVILLAIAFASFLAYQWYLAAGRVRFEGTLANYDYLLVAGQTGRAASVETSVGNLVINGQPLLRFDNSALRKTLEQERQKLIQYARMLPPEQIRLPDPDDPSVGNETLTRRLARKGTEERKAHKALQTASGTEAQAAVAYSRAVIQHANGKLPKEKVDQAEAVLQQAKEELRKAKERHEQASLQRATAETAIRRVLEFHVTSGADKIPLETRLTNYEKQRTIVEELARAVSVAYLAAPFEGKILQVMVQVGDSLTDSTPCFVLQPTSAPFMLNCEVSADKAIDIVEGQQCTVVFPDYGEESQAGYVAAIAKEVKDGKREVTIGILRGEESQKPQLPPGVKGNVTLMLRKPPFTPEYVKSLSSGVSSTAGDNPLQQAPNSGPPEKDEKTGADEVPSSSGVRAVPPPIPVSVKSPFGHDDDGPASGNIPKIRPTRAPQNAVSSPSDSGLKLVRETGRPLRAYGIPEGSILPEDFNSHSHILGPQGARP